MSDHMSDRLAAYVHNELSAADRSDVDLHLKACSECSAELVSLQEIDERLHSTPLWSPKEEVWERIVAQLGVREVATKPVRGSTKPVRGSTNRWLGAVASVAAAAVLLLFLIPRGDSSRVDLDSYVAAVEADPGRPGALHTVVSGFRPVPLDEGCRAAGMADAQRLSPSPRFTLQNARTLAFEGGQVVQLNFAEGRRQFSVFMAPHAAELDFGNRPTERVKMGDWECTQVQSSSLSVFWSVSGDRQSVFVAPANEDFDVARILSFFVYGEWDRSS